MRSPRVRSSARSLTHGALAWLTVALVGCSDPPPEGSGTGGASSGTSTTTGPASSSTTGAGSGSGASGSATDALDTGSSTAPTGTTGDAQGCCSPHAAAGCDDPELAACVCEQEAFCCAFAWDEGCVGLAEQCGGCGAATTTETTTGGPEPSACCDALDVPGCADDPAIEACVCGLDPFCCDTQWDDQCVATGVRQCGATCEAGGDCCSPAATPGCPGDPALEACVCGLDAFCCDQQWDGMCVQIAQDDCGLPCGAGGDCCAPHAGPGCDDMAVEACVCAIDGFCCDSEWDDICVSEAQYGCMAPCGLPPANMGDCCTAQPGPGCGDMAVTDCTCMIDGACCLDPWDEQCIGIAVTACAIECPGFDPLDPCCLIQPGPGCGTMDVEACVCAFDGFCCDTQWDDICVEEAQTDCMLDCTGGGGGGGTGTGGSGTGGSSTT